MTKICGECNVEQPIENYVFKNKIKGIRQRECKNCHKKHMKIYYEKNKSKHLPIIKARKKKFKQELRQFMIDLKSKPCLDCKQSFHWSAMDFDHLKDKSCEIATMVKNLRPKQVILDEIAKCELVCSNCHRIRTFNRRSDPIGI